MRTIVIAIDGPAASGKSTTGRLVARRLGYLHIDTGAMYRAVTLRALEEKLPLEDADRISALAEKTQLRLEKGDNGVRVFVDGREVTQQVRSAQVTRSVSAVSSYQRVRNVLVREQRRMADGGGVVLEGRDIGTVVLPNADLKIFMIANVPQRVERRKKDLEIAGVDVDSVTLEQEIRERDRLDSTREASPLRKASDAIEVDTSGMSIEEQVDFVVARAKEIIEGGGK
ncbi:MAG: (d)CMP kinase [Ignavibacteriales bacterium]|nr:(d)CMP kinase [Ignavibacteriales bacterium]